MLCRKPFIRKDTAYGCGQCLPCRINKRREWTHRIILEAAQYKSNSFVTLTYDKDHAPKDGSLNPAHTRNFLKCLRFAIAPERLRYFIVGEYGDTTFRPHYHAALFNYPSCRYGLSRYSKTNTNCCVACDLIRDRWGHGFIGMGSLTSDSAQYLAGYVAKKMTNAEDERLNGRYPEFARMSLKPGIGASATWELADYQLTYGKNNPDVPGALRHGKRIYPLGRYLRRLVRIRSGLSEKAPQATIDAQKEKMRPLWEAAQHIAPGNLSLQELNFGNLITRAYEGKANSLAARTRIFKKRQTL